MLQRFKMAIAKIGTGLLYGIGIGAIAGPIYYYVSVRMMDSALNESGLQKVVIGKHQETKRGNGFVILGSVENQGAESIRMFVVQVDLFDKSGEFVGQCSEYLTGALKPHELRNFQVSCGVSKDDKPAVEHHSYKVHVLGM